MCPSEQDGGRDRDDHTDASDSEGGQVSETTGMTPGGGDGDTPGTDDGVPPADESDVEPGGGPTKPYGV
jgi:hypothetical protein